MKMYMYMHKQLSDLVSTQSRKIYKEEKSPRRELMSEILEHDAESRGEA